MKQLLSAFSALCLWLTGVTYASAADYTLTSPSGRLEASVAVNDSISYVCNLDGHRAFATTGLKLQLAGGKVIGEGVKASRPGRRSVDSKVASPFYRKSSIEERYNELTIPAGNGWKLVMRAYDDGVAHRWVYSGKKPVQIANELVSYIFPHDAVATAPYVNKTEPKSFQQQFFNSFENKYTVAEIDSLDARRLMFLPLVVEPEDGIKVCITESALESYPGMYLNASGVMPGALTAVFAPVPKSVKQGGHNRLQMLVEETYPYIADIPKARALPWRIAVVVDNDAALAATDLSYLLAEPSRVADTSWIRPGKVAWEWWNDWNVIGVDFPTGVNNDTYKAYIDFAGRNGIEYVILDEGWAVNLEADLMKVVPEIDIRELVEYGRERGVGIILWAGYHAFERDMEAVCKYYSDLGVKGFKVDFMDRDDQLMTDFNYRAAETAARHGLVLDLHGTHKPAGLNRTYPNVLNFEGVNGLEQMKWSGPELDQITYDVQIPFIRQVAGPLDYTQGAMHNASRGHYHASYSLPMSQGTRCRQLAMYVVFDSPFNMLCDTPSNYDANPCCTEFIATIPTVWDETRILDGRIGEYIVTARRSGDRWWIGGMTNGEARDIEVDLSDIITAEKQGVLISDGVNARRNGEDHRHAQAKVTPAEPLKVHLAPGGGFTLRID